MASVASIEHEREGRVAPSRGRLQLRQMRRSSSDEVFLTGEAADGCTSGAPLLEEVALTLAALGIEPLQETIYGRIEARDETLAERARAFQAVGLDPASPCAYLEGAPLHTGALAGVQVWGVIPDPEGATQVTTVGRPGIDLARCWSGPTHRLLHFPVGGRGEPTGAVTRQATELFAGAQAALEAHGLSWLDVPRTWIYVSRILDWYGELNQVRTPFFEERGVGQGPGRAFPASTGIQGRAGSAECALGLLAVDGPGVRVTPLHSSCRQSPAFDYGSAFSRAVGLEVEGRETVFVSGTASIDSAGRTLHVGDAEGQVLETLLCVAALLETRGAGLEDICQATLFCKTPEVLQAYRQVTRLLNVPAFPVVPVLADVCRHELLVEIEAVAHVPEGRPS